MTVMTDVILIDANLTSLEGLQVDAQATRSINLHSNSITACPRAFFAPLSRLTVLNLSSNQIQRISDGSLDGCMSLRDLNLSNNMLDAFPDISHLTRLVRLNLSYNFLYTMALEEMAKDQRNSLYSRTPSLWSLPSLFYLDMKGNRINEVSEFFHVGMRFPNLHDLVVHGDMAHPPRTNPFVSKNPQNFPQILFSILPRLASIDGRTASGAPIQDTFANYVVNFLEMDEATVAEFEQQSEIRRPSELDASDKPRRYSSASRHRDAQIVELEAQLQELTSIVTNVITPNNCDTADDARYLTEVGSVHKNAQKFDRDGNDSDAPSNTILTPATESTKEGAVSTDSLFIPTRIPKCVTTQVSSRRLIWTSASQSTEARGRSHGRDQATSPMEVMDDSPSPHDRSAIVRRLSAPVKSIHSEVMIGKDVVDTEALELLVIEIKAEKSRMEATIAEQEARIKHMDEDRLANDAKYSAALDAHNTELEAQRQALDKALGQLEEKNGGDAELQETVTRLTGKCNELQSELLATQSRMSELEASHTSALEIQQKAHEEKLSDLSIKLRDSGSHREALESAHTFLSAEFQKLDEEHKEVVDKYATAQKALDAMEPKLDKLSKKVIKDRESHSVKLASARDELTSLRTIVQQKESDIEALRKQVFETDLAHQKEVSELTMKYKETLQEERQTWSAKKFELDSQLATSSRDLTQIREAYTMLETEFQKSMEHESSGRQTLQSQLDAASAELHKAQQQVNVLAKSNAELNGLVKELNALLTSQETAIKDLETKNQMTHTIYQEKINRLQESLNEYSVENLASVRNEIMDLTREVELKDKILAERLLEVQALQSELKRIQGNLASAEQSHQHQAKQDAEKITLLTENLRIQEGKAEKWHHSLTVVERECDRVAKELESAAALVKVLTEQRDGLQTKLTDMQSELEALQAAKEDEVAFEQEAAYQLEKQIKEKNKLIGQFQAKMMQFKDERDVLEREAEELKKRLADRNHSIALIEDQVSKIKHVLDAKEREIVELREGESKLQAQISSVTESNQRLIFYEKERMALISKVEQLVEERERLTQEGKVHAQEMAVVLMEMDRVKEEHKSKLAVIQGILGGGAPGVL